MKDSTIIFAGIVAVGLILWNRHQDGSNGVVAGKQAGIAAQLGTASAGKLNGGIATTVGGGDAAGTPGLIAASEPSPVLFGTDTAPAAKMTINDPVSSVGVSALDTGHPLAYM